MKKLKECPPGLCLDEGQYILDGDFEDPVRNGFVVEKEISEDNTMLMVTLRILCVMVLLWKKKLVKIIRCK